MTSVSSFDQDQSIQRTLITPEGVDLRLKLGTAGQRAGAFGVDFVILIISIYIFALLLSWFQQAAFSAESYDGGETAQIIATLGFFLLRNFYFMGFELGSRSATLGKRILGLRVVARDGGRLTADAVIARNLMREIEIFLPLSAMVQLLISAITQDGGQLMAVVLFIWALIFMFFPVFNKDRLRVGDIVAGTWVVYAPRRKLQSDIRSEGSERLEQFAFTTEQLAVYGEYELKTLERVLREANPETLRGVSNTIREKIEWPYGDDDYEFLSAYYAALGARLERGMLFGNRRADKFDDGKIRPGDSFV